MVLGDLGCIELANPHLRLVKKLRASDSGNDVGIMTPQYRSPDVFLGNMRFQEDADMWAFGCMVAELYSRKPLIRVSDEEGPRGGAKTITGKDCIEAIRKEVGLPGQEMAGISTDACLSGCQAACQDAGLPLSSDVPGVETAAKFLDSFPFFEPWFGQTGAAWLASETAKEEKDQPRYAGFHASEGFAGCPESVVALIKDCLRWKPEHRLTLPAARQYGFLQPPGKTPQSVFSMERGKIGAGTILEANLDPDLLHFLQGDSCWRILAKERVDSGGATRSKCVRPDESALGRKTEVPGIVDDTNPPKCLTLNRDKNLPMLVSSRFAAFQRALRKKWRPWLQQLQQKMIRAVKSDNLPDHIVSPNGKPIMEEDFAHNVFAYASIQIMEPGARDDGWHTDGGCSLLHAAVTLWGTRSLQVRLEGKDPVTLEQKPGSFYVGTLTAVQHNVRHHDRCENTYSDDYLQEQPEGKRDLQIAVMIRCDLFRDNRARKPDATPGPAEFFHVVNEQVAQHLATVPVALPDLTDVLDEMRLPSASVPQHTASTRRSGRGTPARSSRGTPAPTPRGGDSD